LLSFQVEGWSNCLAELLPLFTLLWDDVAIDKDKFTAKCDQKKYASLEALDMLHLVTARDGKMLVGFFLMFLTPNAHYDGQGLMGFTDMYFLLPAYRTGSSGVRMFSFMEQTLREKGVVKMYSSHKIHRDRSKMFDFLGWTASDIVYSKVLA
jgi:hypothetical protein